MVVVVRRRSSSSLTAGVGLRVQQTGQRCARDLRRRRMTDTAAKQLRRILQVIPDIADGNDHALGKVAKKAGVDEAVLIADLKSLADRQGGQGGFVEGMQIFITPGTVS